MLSSKEILKIHNESSGGRARFLSTLALSTSHDNVMRSIIWIGTARNSTAKKGRWCKSCTRVIMIVVNANPVVT